MSISLRLDAVLLCLRVHVFLPIIIFQLGVKTSNTKQPRSAIVGCRHRVTTATTFGYTYNNEANIKLSSGRTCGSMKEVDRIAVAVAVAWKAG